MNATSRYFDFLLKGVESIMHELPWVDGDKLLNPNRNEAEVLKLRASCRVPKCRYEPDHVYGIIDAGLWEFSEDEAYWRKVLDLPTCVNLDADILMTYGQRVHGADEENILLLLLDDTVWEFDHRTFKRADGVAA